MAVEALRVCFIIHPCVLLWDIRNKQQRLLFISHFVVRF